MLRRARVGLDLFVPFRAVDRVTSIDYDELWAEGVRGLVFDLENTLALYQAEHLVDGHLGLLLSLRERGFALGLVSNSGRDWVSRVADPLGIPFLGKAGKPRRAAFEKVVEHLGLPAGRLAMIGDQLLTDVFGAQRLGIRGVLVDPLAPREPLTSKVQRAVIPRAVARLRRLWRT